MVTEKRAWAEIDLDAIENNIKEIRRHVGDKPKIMGVVKADGYGHGYLEVAKRFSKMALIRWEWLFWMKLFSFGCAVLILRF